MLRHQVYKITNIIMFDDEQGKKDNNQGGEDRKTEDNSAVPLASSSQKKITIDEQNEQNQLDDLELEKNHETERRAEDPFAEIEKEKPEAFKPKAEAPASVSDEYEKEREEKQESKNRIKKLIFLLVFLICFLLIITGAVWGYSKYFSAETKEESALIIEEEVKKVENEPDELINTEGSGEEGIVMPETPPSQVGPEVEEAIIKDSDSDGLSDSEEMILGTNASSVDSDNDGLFDREEVKVYKTDPLNPDTDGDGFLDGNEVRDGYNPNGAGRLYEIK